MSDSEQPESKQVKGSLCTPSSSPGSSYSRGEVPRCSTGCALERLSTELLSTQSPTASSEPLWPFSWPVSPWLWPLLDAGD